MSRPLRIQFPNASYHITSRGIRRDPIFFDDDDRRKLIEKMIETFEKYLFIVHAFCLMPNHYHVFLQTPLANLSAGLHDLNASYANWLRCKHRLVGHVFQGRFKSILVDTETYAVNLSIYIHLNPCRWRLVELPEEYEWSSCRDYLGLRAPLSSGARSAAGPVHRQPPGRSSARSLQKLAAGAARNGRSPEAGLPPNRARQPGLCRPDQAPRQSESRRAQYPGAPGSDDPALPRADARAGVRGDGRRCGVLDSGNPRASTRAALAGHGHVLGEATLPDRAKPPRDDLGRGLHLDFAQCPRVLCAART